MELKGILQTFNHKHNGRIQRENALKEILE